MIEFRGTVDRILYRRALSSRLRALRRLGMVLAFVGLWGLLNVRGNDPVSWAVPLFLFIFGAYCFLLPWIVVRRAFATSRLMGLPFSGRLDEHGFAYESVHGRMELPWSAFHRAWVKPDLIMLDLSAQQFYLLEPSFFTSPAEWETARQIISTRVQKK